MHLRRPDIENSRRGVRAGCGALSYGNTLSCRAAAGGKSLTSMLTTCEATIARVRPPAAAASIAASAMKTRASASSPTAVSDPVAARGTSTSMLLETMSDEELF